MAHINTLTDLFYEFSVCLNTDGLACNGSYTLNTHAKARILLSRLYYAVFHKVLEDFSHIRTSRQGQKHKRMIEALQASSNPDHRAILILVQKLQDLRIWADYEHTNTIYDSASPAGLGYYFYQMDLLMN